MAEEKIILVDKKDNEIGEEEKLKAHQEGKLHRAFSIFIFNSKGEMMLQQRAKTKYHSGGLWSNTCCSHPRAGELLEEAVKRRLKEEMGFLCELEEIFSFVYKAKIGDLIEYEFDHIFVGKFEENPKPNRKEVENWKWINQKELKGDIKKNPEKYTYWFEKILERVFKYQNENK